MRRAHAPPAQWSTPSFRGCRTGRYAGTNDFDAEMMRAPTKVLSVQGAVNTGELRLLWRRGLIEQRHVGGLDRMPQLLLADPVGLQTMQARQPTEPGGDGCIHR